METAIRSLTVATGGARTAAPARAQALRAPQPGAAPVPHAARMAAPLKRGLNWDERLQGEVARAQQALDYLERVATQLESVKGELAAKLSGARSDSRQLEARLRQLNTTLAARTKGSGGGVDSRLDFDGQPASQRFRIRALDVGALQAQGAQALSFTVGGGPLLTAELEPGLSGQQIAQRIDRALAPAKVHAALDGRGQLVFSTPESNWPALRDGIAVSGRGRVATEEEAPPLETQGLGSGNDEALRQGLREVVQALARVRRSQDAASAALGDANARAAQAQSAAQAADAASMAQNFAGTAASPDYDSLLAISSALVGVSRERVLALLNLR